MKFKIFLFVIFSLSVQAHDLGLQSALNVSLYDFKGVNDIDINRRALRGFEVGAFYTFPLNDQLALEFQTGYTRTSGEINTLEGVNSQGYIVRLQSRLNFDYLYFRPLVKVQARDPISFFGGLTISNLISAKVSERYTRTDAEFVNQKYSIRSGAKDIRIAGIIGAELKVEVRSVIFMPRISIEVGASDSYKNDNVSIKFLSANLGVAVLL